MKSNLDKLQDIRDKAGAACVTVLSMKDVIELGHEVKLSSVNNQHEILKEVLNDLNALCKSEMKSYEEGYNDAITLHSDNGCYL
jgi:uncharacterized protein involved in propanediol utilization